MAKVVSLSVMVLRVGISHAMLLWRVNTYRDYSNSTSAGLYGTENLTQPKRNGMIIINGILQPTKQQLSLKSYYLT